MHYAAGFLRKGLAFFLISLLAFLVGNLFSTEPASSPNQRFEFHDDIQALVLSLPDSFHHDQKLVPILAALAAAYPKTLQALEIRSDQRLLVCLAGQKFIYDDGITKTPEQRLDHPDIKDMFHDTYPLANPTDRLPKDFDPGRYRVDALFMALYGDSELAVASKCVVVEFCGNRVKFNARYGAADALRAVSADLTPLLAQKPEIRSYVDKLAGTFNWRKVAGTESLSNHSFATAIDLNVKKAAYWRWVPLTQLETFSRKNWPTEIIETFERHGFIWGGKWWHFDTMHFEYRPEIIAYAKSAAASAPKDKSAH
ncbi:MAG TPA: M15 family metallopeptidase [Candidatus Udaeobacter sp.]|nr:M15 family metallopeptidase [Candidatus Udaeobacter sp.]